MSYCETTALEIEREILAMPPRIGDVALPAAEIGTVSSALSEFDLELRRLHHDRIGHAVVGIEIIGRRDLRAAGEIDHQTVGDVTLGQPDILRARPIDIDVEGRIAGRLLDPGIRNARDMADAAEQLVGIGEIGVDVGAADLQVDRRRRAEIQDLADDVGRKESEGHAGKGARQLFAQRLDIVFRRPVAFPELDLDIAILRTDHAGVVVGHVDARDRHADIVGQRLDLVRRDDPANRLLHLGELIGALLDAGADLGTDVHQDRAGIDGGKEIAPEVRHQQERHGDEAEKADQEQRTPPHGKREQFAIDAAHALEARLETALKPQQRIARRRRLVLPNAAHAVSADISPWSAPACATG